MSVVLCLQSGFVSAVEKDGSHAMGIAACIMVFLFVVSLLIPVPSLIMQNLRFMGLFTVGFQAAVWVYPAEILPLRLRAKGSALSTAVNWMCNYLVVLITPVSIRNIGYRTYIIFAVLNASFVPVIYFTFPETKGLSLEEIDKLFSQSRRRSNENSERTPLL
ncbi:hypothetical protein FRC12_002676 [Ceratobasidium sp. 428]|nr:hypothetical protein FRC12_002676 [Ceratobasidium sp. 428]